MLITCSFKEADQYEGEKYSVANSQPEPQLYRCKKFLAPPWPLVHGYKDGHISEDSFTVQYKHHLDGLGKYAVIDLEYDVKRAGDGNIVYLCWEPYGEFCHRHILVDWMIEKFGLKEEMLIRR